MSKYQAICPVCGAFGAPEIFLGEAVRREAIAKALRMPAPLATQIQAYIGLFRPAQRGHSLDRVERLMGELLVPIEAGKVRVNGRDWPAPIEVWKEALDQMLARRERLTLPLKNHNYLFEVVAGESDKVEAKTERQREEQLKHQVRTGPKPGSIPQGYDPMAAWKRDMERLGKSHLIPQGESSDHDDAN